MKWNWQQKDWPDFAYDCTKIEALEKEFLKASGILIGAFSHLNEEDGNQIKIDVGICMT